MSCIQHLFNQTQNEEKMYKYAAIALSTLTGLYVAKRIYDGWNLPPGPVGLPIIGNLLRIDSTHLHLSCQEISNKYGPLCSFYLGQNLIILVNDYDMAKEMFNMPVFSGRIQNEFIKALIQNCGVVLTDGPEWANQRRMVLQILRDLGYAKILSQDLITQETYNLEKVLKEACKDKKGFRFAPLMLNSSNSIIAKLTFGMDISENKDDEFHQIAKDFTRLEDDNLLLNPPFLFPKLGLMSVLRLLPSVKKDLKKLNYIHQYGFKKIKERKALIGKEIFEPQCLCDSYILEQRKAEENGDTKTFKDFQLMRICVELFIAGTDTTARSLEWIMVYLAVYPEIQEKMHNEIISVIGESRRVEMKDKIYLHYSQAVVEESYRKAAIASLGLFHRATETTYYKGYKIPQNATLLPFIYGIHHNPNNFSNPEKFCPERFIDKEGTFKPDSKVIPFSVGKRSCLGESLARMEVFMFSVFIMQHFKVELHPDYKLKVDEILKGKLGTLFAANKHLLLLHER